MGHGYSTVHGGRWVKAAQIPAAAVREQTWSCTRQGVRQELRATSVQAVGTSEGSPRDLGKERS